VSSLAKALSIEVEIPVIDGCPEPEVYITATEILKNNVNDQVSRRGKQVIASKRHSVREHAHQRQRQAF
jgi:hypothetical protein